MKSKVHRLWSGLPQGATVMVDTAPFIYVLESHSQFADQFVGLFEAAAAGDLTIALSTITLAEVLTGPFKAGQTALAKRYEKALSQYNVIPVSTPIAVLAAQLRVQYRLKLPDAIQLATGLDIGAAAFVTHDRDFSQVTGVDILTGERGLGA
ncbi:MAG: type II toxin-antitoxin system VapC family toxin [Rhodoferax sp.]|uniref:type II toxin-antitoxin system VapC family toxin n=1 Tax=Rhodoferax sp. TaxID=50421 RepID=UPI001811AE0D|nr:PIN domain-containing protein [Rhodoferax sp.]NMM14296.1 type II toxin-antitoxin system VapC family toxin [Rhodoferax sp.]NMM18717.1 type II toxin-antitoxin system VapC family toxin [Rhodoferax sp.]